ncbi:MAG TPA: VCBS repeat-containing protein [Polyangia bacterium]|nr:VCBS repeat-containing protein [Polyangia bacterium]
MSPFSKLNNQPVNATAVTQGTLTGDKTAILGSSNVTFGPYNISLHNVGSAPLSNLPVSHTFVVTVWGSTPGQVAGSNPLSFVKLGEVTRTLTAPIGQTVSESFNIPVVMPSVFMDIKIVAEFSPGAFGRPDASQFPKVITYPSTSCGAVTPGLASPTDACMQGAVNPTGLLVPDVMPLSIIYEPPGNCSWSNLTFSATTGSAMSLTQADSKATNTLWNYSAAAGIFTGSSNTTQTIVKADTATSVFHSTTTQAFGTSFGLPSQSPGNPSCNANIPVGDTSSTNGPGVGDQFVFVVQPTFLYWDTAGLTTFRLSTQQASGTQETLGTAFVRQIDPSRPSLRPSFMAQMTPAQLQTIRSLDPFAPAVAGASPAPQTFQPQACSSGAFLSPSRYVYLGRRCLATGTSIEPTQGSAYDSTTASNLTNGMQTVTSSNGDQSAKNTSLVVGAFAALVTFAVGNKKDAFDNFGKASSIFDQYILHDSTTTTVTENITSNPIVTNSQMNSYAQTFLVKDQNAEVDMDLYYDSFFGTIAFNRIASCNAPRIGKSCAPRPPIETYVPGDFNHDGRTDLVITTASGSYWYFSNGDGSWSVPYSRGDLPLGAVSYVPGDFNGDGYTDLVITTASGSYLYLSNGDGTWRTPYSRGDLPLGAVSYVPGDFDGDGYTDLIITTASGSYWYFSNGDGTWTSAYTRSDLSANVHPMFTTGDFDGDGRTDVIISTSNGSTWLFSTGRGTWKTAYSRPDLTADTTTFTVGDFDGQGNSDMVITTPSGSYWYFSNSDGTWTNPYSRSDLPQGAVKYLPGFFDTDQPAKTDLVITTASGSYWYFSNGDGTWDVPYVRYDLGL